MVKEAEAKQQFEASLLQLKELEDKEKEVKEAREKNPNIIAVPAIATTRVKGKPPLALG